jgi:hypothetical protein
MLSLLCEVESLESFPLPVRAAEQRTLTRLLP